MAASPSWEFEIAATKIIVDALQIKAWDPFDQSPNCVHPAIKDNWCGLFVMTDVNGKASENGLMTSGFMKMF